MEQKIVHSVNLNMWSTLTLLQEQFYHVYQEVYNRLLVKLLNLHLQKLLTVKT